VAARTLTTEATNQNRSHGREDLPWDNPRLLWQKYCGFLELSPSLFMDIQSQLLLEQVQLLANCSLGKKFLQGRIPRTVEEFRNIVPLTSYSDYLPTLEQKDEGSLAETPFCWSHTTGDRGDFKFVPYTHRAYDLLLDNVLAAFLLASAKGYGEVNLKASDRVMYNIPPRPYLSGLVTFGMQEKFGFQGVLNAQESEPLDFHERTERQVQKALDNGVDVIVSMTSILVKLGAKFAEQSQRDHPLKLGSACRLRLAKAWLNSRIRRRPLRPSDIWPIKAVLGWGIDSAFFKEQVYRYWGKEPYEFYACTEGGVMAVQSWKHQGMILVPYSDFYEFIPEEESIKSWRDRSYQPATVLADQLEAGKSYEMVITNFYGMPFMRYRVGHLIKVVSLGEKDSGIKLPSISLEGRCDDLIDVAGFTRLSEKTVWSALSRADLLDTEWVLCKEANGSAPVLHLYLEADAPNGDIGRRIEASLKEVDPFFSDLEDMLEIRPFRLTNLAPGTFKRFYDEKRKAGVAVGQLRPPRINPSPDTIRDLLRLGQSG